MRFSPDQRRRAMRIGTIAALAVGGAVVAATAAGVVLATGAVLSKRSSSATDDAPPAEQPPSRTPLRFVGTGLRYVTYGWLLGVAAVASWLAKLARPTPR